MKFRTLALIALLSSTSLSAGALTPEAYEKCKNELLQEAQQDPTFSLQNYTHQLFVSAEKWISHIGTCNMQDAYYEIRPTTTGEKKFRLRYVFYGQVTAENHIRLAYYTPWMDQIGLRHFLSRARAASPVKSLNYNGLTINKYFHRVTVDSGQGEVELSSIESALPKRLTDFDKNLEYMSLADENDYDSWGDGSFDYSINWTYKGFISGTYHEDVENSKAPLTEDKVFRFDGRTLRQISDIREIFPESTLLSHLKQDWLLRNSNQWVRFAKATNWNDFWSLSKETEESIFESYSNRVRGNQIKAVADCAVTSGKQAEKNLGYKCVRNKGIIIFRYAVAQTALTQSFVLSSATEGMRVKIPLYSDSAGTAALHLLIPVSQQEMNSFSDSWSFE